MSGQELTEFKERRWKNGRHRRNIVGILVGFLSSFVLLLFKRVMKFMTVIKYVMMRAGCLPRSFPYACSQQNIHIFTVMI